MTSRFSELAVDAHDPARLADFWCAVLDYVVLDTYEGLVEIGPADLGSGLDFSSRWRQTYRDAPAAPTIVFAPVPEGKTVKNRLHIDVSPIGSAEAEVARLLSLGAEEADVGQGDVPWTVMRDPEGNEFCVLRSLDT